MKKKILIGSIIAVVILVLVSFTGVVGKDLESDKSVYIQPNKELTREHLICLLRGFLHTRNLEINKILIKIIFEIIRDGDATSYEIQGIVASNITNIKGVYILAEVKTTETTDGGVGCFPGVLRSIFGYNAKGAFVKYDDEGHMNKILYGWNLHIDGELISKNKGYIFGYFGYVKNGFHGEFSYFDLDGFGVLIIHGK